MAAGPSYCAAHDSRLCRVLAMVADVGKRVAQVRIRSGVLVCLLSSHAFRVSRLIVKSRRVSKNQVPASRVTGKVPCAKINFGDYRVIGT